MTARADGAGGDLERDGDLIVAELGELTHEEHAAQLLGQGVDRPAYGAGSLARLDLGVRRGAAGHVLAALRLERQPLPEPASAAVVLPQVERDAEEERLDRAHVDALAHAPQAQERLLHQFHGLVAVPHPAVDDVEERALEPAVELDDLRLGEGGAHGGALRLKRHELGAYDVDDAHRAVALDVGLVAQRPDVRARLPEHQRLVER